MELKKEEWKTPHIQKIGEALIERCETDAELKEKLEAADCTIDDVYAYIVSEASKVAVNRCACIDCYTVYDMAVKCIKEGLWKKSSKPTPTAPKSTTSKVEAKPKKEVETPKKEEKKLTPKPKKETFEDVFGGLF